jgi:transposase
MATRRTTSNKRERERSKQAKATAKRERRLDKSPDEDAEIIEFDENSATTEELIERIAAMHEQYDAGQLSFEAFDEEKAELMGLLTARLSE